MTTLAYLHVTSRRRIKHILHSYESQKKGEKKIFNENGLKRFLADERLFQLLSTDFTTV